MQDGLVRRVLIGGAIVVVAGGVVVGSYLAGARSKEDPDEQKIGSVVDIEGKKDLEWALQFFENDSAGGIDIFPDLEISYPSKEGEALRNVRVRQYSSEDTGRLYDAGFAMLQTKGTTLTLVLHDVRIGQRTYKDGRKIDSDTTAGTVSIPLDITYVRPKPVPGYDLSSPEKALESEYQVFQNRDLEGYMRIHGAPRLPSKRQKIQKFFDGDPIQRGSSGDTLIIDNLVSGHPWEDCYLKITRWREIEDIEDDPLYIRRARVEFNIFAKDTDNKLHVNNDIPAELKKAKTGVWHVEYGFLGNL